MKLLRYGPLNQEKPGILHGDNTLRDLSGCIPDIGPLQLSSDSVARLHDIDASTLPIVQEWSRLGVPLHGVRKFIAIGLNYRDHAAESNMKIPEEPIVFTKAISCLSGPNDDVLLPRGSKKSDWEVELGCVIGTTARYVPESKALQHVGVSTN